MSFNKIAPFVVAFAIWGLNVAQAAPVPVTIAHSVEFPVLPDKASVVVSQGTQVVAVVPAAIVVRDGSSAVTVIGRATLPIDGGPYKALFTVHAKSGEIGSSVREIRDVRLEPAVLLDESELKRRLGEQKAELYKWEKQASDQRVRLKKVQQQADTVSSVGKIIDADEELRAAKDEHDRLVASVSLAQERQLALKTRDTPPNFKKREAELSTYLNLLSTEVKASEEGGAFDDATQELQAKKDLIESTKYEHIDLLKDELAELRRKREALERKAAEE
ncbi:MAG: hypothetical protein RL518_1668 [Pseudomonadota bacterium]